MLAIGYRKNGPIDAHTFERFELPRPTARGRDLLVEIKAISVNPVDGKIRTSRAPRDGKFEVIGYDAAGVVAEVGSEVTDFKVGDEVYYAGSVIRSGTNAEFHLVDERLVGRKPATLGWSDSAAMPLTSLTAWEALFDRIDLNKPVPGGAPVLLIIGGAGGVGSIAIQLAKKRTDLTVVATASRPQTVEWVKGLGADHVVNHRAPLAPQVAALGLGAPSFVFSTTQTNMHAKDIATLIAPQGRLCLIDSLDTADVFMSKSVSIHWELMFTRSIHQTADMAEQGQILNKVGEMLDSGALVSTARTRLSPINPETLKQAHQLSESGKSIGKTVIEGF